MQLTIDTKIKDVWAVPDMAQAASYFIGGSKDWNEKLEAFSFRDIQRECPTWNADAMVFGVNRLMEIAGAGKPYLYDVYTETIDDERKKNVKLFHFPGKAGMPFVIVCAGGGFGAVASIAEAFPVAARLNELGYTAFCLNYRTGDMTAQYFGIVPKALDDFAAAYRFIIRNADGFSVDATRYGVCGFSAGGHLCSQWCNKEVGYFVHGCKKPDMLFLAYGIIAKMQFKTEREQKLWEFMSTVMYGIGHTPDDVQKHNIIELADKGFPPTYIIQSRDDDTVPAVGSESLAETLKKHNVPCEIEMINTGGHGFGLGMGTEAEGWLDRAVTFWERIHERA